MWSNVLFGARDSFSPERRVFNAVSFFSACILIVALVVDVLLHQWVMSGVVLLMLILLCVIYYRGLFRMKYSWSVETFAACSYVILILNYFFNGGIEGPTLFLFFLTYQLLASVSDKSGRVRIVVAHLAVVLALVVVEYMYPNLVAPTYGSKLARFADIAVTFGISLLFLHIAAGYMRNYFHEQKAMVVENRKKLAEQHDYIAAQNLQLERVNAEKDKMFSIISHDLRAPLSSLLAYFELVSNNLLNEQEKAEMESELFVQIKYTNDLLMNLLYWAKAQMNGVNPRLTEVNVSELLEEMREYKEHKAAKKKIVLKCHISENIYVFADRDMLKIVIRNLVSNAIKFTTEGGEVVIRLHRSGHTATLDVQDTGVGIPVEKQSELFTLKAVSSYGTSNEKGIGLGLVLCKELIDYQKGEISFMSQLGQGSTFSIRLQLAEAKVEAQPETMSFYNKKYPAVAAAAIAILLTISCSDLARSLLT